MKLLEIEIENFGVFGERTLTFSEGPVQVVYGANEVGKSTLLQLIRETLFGFAVRNPFAFETHSGRMAATVVGRLRSGKKIRFRRRKGNKNRVQGEYLETHEPIDEAQLLQLFGGAHAELFQHVFGISLAELQLGRDSLKKANLNDAIYGSGLGSLTSFQEIRTRLQMERDELYKKRGRSGQVINRLIRELQERESQLEQQTLSPQRYDELLQKLEAAEQEVAERSEVVRGLRDELTRVDRLRRGLPYWHRLKVLADQQAQIQLPERSKSPVWEELGRKRQRWTELNEQICQGEQSLQELRQRRSEAAVEPGVLQQAAAISSLNQHVGRVEGLCRDIPRRHSETKVILDEVEAALQQLDPSWTTEILDRYELGEAQLDAVNKLVTRFKELDENEKFLRHQLRQVDEEIGELQEVVAEAVVNDTRQHDTLVRQGELVLASQPRRDQLAADAEKYRRQSEQLLERLAMTVKIECRAEHREPIVTALRTPVPLPATIEEFRQRWQQQQQRVDAAEDLIARLETQRAEFLAEVQALEKQEVPGLEQLQSLRKRRDELLERLAVSVHEPAPKPRPADMTARMAQIREAVALADRCADERQRQAERVGHHDQLCIRLEKTQCQIDNEQSKRSRLQADFDELREQWKQLWRASGFAVQSPPTMLQWCEFREQWRDANEQLAECEKLLQQLEADRESVLEQLRAAVVGQADDQSSEGLRELVDRLRHSLEQTQEQAAARRHAEVRLRRLAQNRREVQRQLVACEKEVHQWQNAWSNTLRKLGFPADWDVELVPRLLQRLAVAATRRWKARSLRQRISDMESDLAEYSEQVERVCSELQIGWDSQGDPTEIVRMLQQRLADTQEASRECRRLERRIKDVETTLEACRRECHSLETDLGEYQQAWSLKSVEELDMLVDAAERRAALEQEANEIFQKLELCLAPMRLENVEAELEHIEESELDRRFEELRQQLEAAEQTHDGAIQQQALAKKSLDEARQEDQVAETANRLESTRAELVAAVDRWAPLQIAQSLLQQARDDFERQQQPELLQHVESIFSRMTEGRYVGIQRKLDEQGTLIVEQCDGQCKEPGQLSTGTREQLYLAIRLAYIQHYSRTNEPLPVFMDDVLVNFDSDRMLQTLRVLHELGPEIQVVMLTCHRHTAERVFEHFRDTAVTCLGGPQAQQELDEWLQASSLQKRPRSGRRSESSSNDPSDQKILFS